MCGAADPPTGDGGRPFRLGDLFNIAIGVFLVLFGLIAIVFWRYVYITSVGRLQGVITSILFASIGAVLILFGWRGSHRGR